MSAFPYQPPSQSLTVFNDAVFQSGEAGLTKAQTDKLYCQFPQVQGGVSIPEIKSDNTIKYTYLSIPSLTNQSVGFNLVVYNPSPTTNITSNTPTNLCSVFLQQEGFYYIQWQIQYQTTGSSTVSSLSSYLTQGSSALTDGYMIIPPNQTDAGSFSISTGGNNGVISQTGSAIISTYAWGSRTVSLWFNVVYSGSAMNVNNNPTSFRFPSGFSYTRIA